MDQFTEIISPIKDEFSEFKTHYSSLFSSDVAVTNSLLEFLRSRRGKMMRPILILLTAKSFGPIPNNVYHVAAALELLHQGSLIHDDVVDDSDERRGRPSANAAFNNKVAVLLGDYVVAMALEQISKANHIKLITLMSDLTKTLSEGEILQLDSRNDNILSEEKYFNIISRKTAYLFSTCTKMSSLLCDASEEDIEAMASFGKIAGLCFQIKDDIFDYHHSTEIGKPFGNDLREGKFTLPAIYALSHSDRDWSEAIDLVKSCTASDELISEISDFTIKNGGIQYAENKMEELKSFAFSILPSHIPDDIRNSFTCYLDLIINRQK